MKVSTRFNLNAFDDGLRAENAFPLLDVLGPSVTMWAPIKGVKYPYTPAAYMENLPVSAEGEEYEFETQEWQIASPPPPPHGWTAEIVVQTLAPYSPLDWRFDRRTSAASPASEKRWEPEPAR